jgi:hypothetical protein
LLCLANEFDVVALFELNGFGHTAS